MDIRIERERFLGGLALAKSVADTRSTMIPILGSVLLRAEGEDRLMCAATDLNITVVAQLPAHVKEEGSIALAAKPLVEIVKGLSDGEVHVRVGENQRAEIRAGRAQFKLAGLAPADFPKLPDASQVVFSAVEVKVLRDLVVKTAFAASSDQSRPHLCGALLATENGHARMVATDGHRLAKAEAAWNGGPAVEAGVVIPRKGLVEMERLLADAGETCEVGIHDGTLFVRASDTLLAVRLPDVKFPPWEQVVPKENGTCVTVKRQPLIDALQRVSLMAPNGSPAVRIEVRRGHLKISSENADLGEAHEELEVTLDGKPVAVGFNARYLVEPLEAMETEEVRLDLSGEQGPAVVRPVESKGPTVWADPLAGCLNVVMPMRV